MPVQTQSAAYQLIKDDETTFLLQIEGTWLMRHGIPSSESLHHDIQDADSVKQLRFDAQNLEKWDSGLLTFLLKCNNFCQEHGIELDYSSLPEDIAQLVQLPQAVPEKKGFGYTQQHKSFFYKVGETSLEFSDGALDFLSFLGESVKSLVRLFLGKSRFRVSDCFVIIQQCGAEALPIVTLISFLVGFIMAFVGAIQMSQFGADIYVANLVGLAMVREMGAMMAAIILCGRTGAAFAAHLGSMKVTEEIDALKTLGIDAIDFLVLPRLIALIIMLPLLCVYADFVGILGGLCVTIIKLDVTLIQYIAQTERAIQINDFMVGIIKSTAFGIILAGSGCLRGMQCGNSSSAVGLAATSAVVTGITGIIIADAIFTVIFNALNM